MHRGILRLDMAADKQYVWGMARAEALQGCRRAIAMLQDVLSRNEWSHRELGDRVGAESSIVCRWLKSERVPGLGPALAMQRLFGIPAELWVQGRIPRKNARRSTLAA